MNNLYRPTIYSSNNPTDIKKIADLLKKNTHLHVYDHLEVQLGELIELNNPKKHFSSLELKKEIKKHIGTLSLKEYGVWVYYPWDSKIVHILDKEEFIKVRTSRNQNKITNDERKILENKTVAIIGLSVGHSIALTMAMERTFGEIRLADFDELELSNYNRIKTKLSNLGLNKCVSVAREIAEFDPFLKVNCFIKGITEENIDEFLLKDKKVDLLVEECDDIYMKIYARKKARSYKIPVIMDTSDRGMLDLERFDIEPNRPLFHGLLEESLLDSVKKNDTKEKRMKIAMLILGEATMSERIKNSINEIGNTLRTWPQLASAISLGGSIVTDVARRLFLNQNISSGRYYVDIEKIIPSIHLKK